MGGIVEFGGFELLARRLNPRIVLKIALSRLGYFETYRFLS